MFSTFAFIMLGAPVDVTVRQLANEAYLLDDGRRAVLLDAFVPEPFYGYEPLAAETWQAMRSGAPPFDRVVAAVVSHRHSDHFQADAAAEFLRAHPGVTLFGPPDIVGPLREAGYDGDRIVAVLPDYGEQDLHEIAGVKFRLFRLRHMPAGKPDVQNLATLIDMGGMRFLHVGDAYPERGNFQPYDFSGMQIDAAFIPDVFYRVDSYPDGPEITRENVAAACVFATHVAPDGSKEKLARFGREFPDLRLPAQGGGMLDLSGCRP